MNTFRGMLLLTASVTMLLLRLRQAQAFVVPCPSHCHSTSTITSTSTSRRMPLHFVLYYKDDGKDEDGEPAQQTNTNNKRLSIPVLGPLVNRPPILPGQEFILQDPTPMQWQSLEQCIKQHAAHVKDEDSAAGVTAAPLIALIDEYTGGTASASTQASQLTSTASMVGRYATIAAIVGISNTENNDDSNDDGSSFMESIRNGSSSNNKKTAKIRLVGIGRAALTDFFYQSAKQDAMDDEGNLLDVPESSSSSLSASASASKSSDDDDDDEDDDDDDRHHDCDTTDNIIMANFRLVTDSAARQQNTAATTGKTARSVHASPVHAVAELSQLTTKIHALHEERKQLVAGLQAGNARLAFIQQQREELLEDHDGLGMLFATKDDEEELLLETFSTDQQPVIARILQEYPETTTAESSSSATTTTTNNDSDSSSSSSSSPLAALPNYGLGVTASAVSTMTALTWQQLETLQPYYSPNKHASEEHYYELYSFTAVAALADSFIGQQQQQSSSSTSSLQQQQQAAAWAVRCRNTADRMRAVSVWMWDHVRLLRTEVAAVSQELRECGEECTDLW